MNKHLLRGLLLGALLCPAISHAQTERPLRIGVVFPFTGKQARQGQLGRTGIELALSEFSDFQPAIIYEDSHSETKDAVAAFNKLQVLDKTDAVLTMGSPAAMALLPLANRAKIPLLAMVVVSDYSAPDDFGFRLMGTAQGFGRRITELLSAELPTNRIALVYVEDDYGTAYAKYFDETLAKEGRLVAKESYLPGTNDFRVLLMKLKAANPQAVVLASWGVEAGTILRQAKELNLNAQAFICPSACDNPDIAVSGAGATDPLIIIASASKTTPEREQILAERFNEKATSVVLRFYDAIAVLRRAAALCKDTGYEKQECLRNTIATTKDLTGSSYPISFDENGDILDRYQLKIVRDSKLVGARVENQTPAPE